MKLNLDNARVTLLEELTRFLEAEGFGPKPCHTSCGDPILRLPNNLSLMIMVEINDDITGEHKVVTLGDLAKEITEWNQDNE